MGQNRSVVDCLWKYKLYAGFGVFLLFLIYQSQVAIHKQVPSNLNRTTYLSLNGYWSGDERMKELEFVEQNFEQLEQDDERLIRYVRNRYLIPPSTQPYNFKKPGASGKTEYSEWVRNFYKGKVCIHICYL